MKPIKRLFLFAGFDQDNIVDNTAVYYVKELSKLGDVIFVMDNDLSNSEIKKISKIPNVIYTESSRHHEYDFGSYKRGFLWAHKKQILKKYDWVYFVNDSVYGPLFDLTNTLQNLEKSGADFTGMTSNCDKDTPIHVQSWFIGFNKKIFTADFFKDFMQKITHISKKTELVMKYEVGLSCMLMRHGFKSHVLLDAKYNTVYNNPRAVLTKGLPFVKKNGASNLRRMYFLYPYVEHKELLDYIGAHMQRHGIKMVKDSFVDMYELRFLGLPILKISGKKSKCYKIYLFKYIPLLKIRTKFDS